MNGSEELENLRRKNLRLQTLLDNIDQAILTFGQDLRLDPDFSEKVAEIFDRQSSELREKTITELLLTPSDIASQRQELIEAALVKLFAPHGFTEGSSKDRTIEESLPLLPTECRLNTGNCWKHLKISWRWLFAENGSLDRILLILEDVTETKEMQDALELQRERLLTMGETSAHFAHEIASPTQLIGLTSQQVKQQLVQLKAELASLFEGQEDESALALATHYQSSLDHSLELLGDIVLAQRRIQELHAAVRNYFRQSTSLEEFSFHQLIQECLVLAKARAKNVKIAVDCAESLYIQGIRSQWMSVLSNLINNASDVILETTDTAAKTGQILVTAKGSREGFQLSVEDSGPGVPEHLEEQIFTASFSTKKTGEGTGLGLAITRRIVEAEGGSIHVKRSQDLGGAKFVIKVPLKIL